MRDRVEKLTARQRECLRGKWQHKLDKQIAGELGLSTRAVEDHLRLVRERIGVTSTRAAVEIVARELGWDHVEKPQSRATTVPVPAPALPILAATESDPDEMEDVVRDGGAFRPSTTWHTPPSVWPLSLRREKRNDLSVQARLLWPLNLAAAIILLMVGTLASSDYAGRLVGDILRRFS